MMDIYIYGAGTRGRILINLADGSEVNILGVVDANRELQGKKVGKYTIQEPNSLTENEDIKVCVSFYSVQLKNHLWDELSYKYGIKKENIFSFNDILKIIYKDIEFAYVSSQKTKKYMFVGDWNMQLGGVESWLRDIVCEFSERNNPNVYLVTDRIKSNYPIKIKEKIIDFSYDCTPIYSREYIEKGLGFVLQNLPCTMIFSRVDELLLTASLVKDKYPDDLKIIMVDHGACDGMTRDIVSYMKEIDYYVTVSSGIKSLLEDHGIDSEKIMVMTCPIKHNKSCKRNSNSILQIGYAGRLEVFEKRMDILLKLLDELENSNVVYQFNIAGSGTFENEIMNHIKTKKLQGKVRMYGQLDRIQMGKFWSEQDIAVNVSDNEGRPISNLEAMIYGAVPVVTNTIGSLEDVVNEINGYIVPLEDYKMMAEKIVYLSDHKKVLKRMSEKAQCTIIDKVSMDLHMQLWDELFHLCV